MATAGGIQGYFKEAEPQGRWINNLVGKAKDTSASMPNSPTSTVDEDDPTLRLL